jgi:nuclear pore complex protein Nup62
LAEHLNTKLDDMASSLSIVINELNSARKKSENSSNTNSALDESPLESITQILNAHLTSLEWIERSSSKLEVKVERLKGLEKQVASKVLNR